MCIYIENKKINRKKRIVYMRVCIYMHVYVLIPCTTAAESLWIYFFLFFCIDFFGQFQNAFFFVTLTTIWDWLFIFLLTIMQFWFFQLICCLFFFAGLVVTVVTTSTVADGGCWCGDTWLGKRAAAGSNMLLD